MIRTYVTPPHGLSRAMDRVALAIARHAPEGVEIVTNVHEADLQVLHVIGEDAVAYRPIPPMTAVMQYCTNGLGRETWAPLWERAEAVWSYYDLDVRETAFYQAPLGVDVAFSGPPPFQPPERDYLIMTSGYVTGGAAEAIEEPAHAAARLGSRALHLGPQDVVGLTKPLPQDWMNALHVGERVLANLYRRWKWVSGMRFGEGFQMPVIEGLACGCRPIVFDRPEMRRWFDGHAVFVPECHDAELEERLAEVMSREPEPVSRGERRAVLEKFDWARLVAGLWSHVLGYGIEGKSAVR